MGKGGATKIVSRRLPRDERESVTLPAGEAVQAEAA
jgi:hypothetical protein